MRVWICLNECNFHRICLICPEEIELFENCKKLISCLEKSEYFMLKILVTGGNHAELSLPADRSKWPKLNIYMMCQSFSPLNLENRLKGFSLKSFSDER